MKYECIHALSQIGINYNDAWALRRISMTLHRWHELECGSSDDYKSCCVVRGRMETRYGQHAGGHGAHHVFLHDDDGVPFMKVHIHASNGTAHYYQIADREKGAHKLLAAIMKHYPSLKAYVQGDPRGCALYILRPEDIPEGCTIDSCYSRGVAVYK